mmetsp:Transcript_9381/g.14035  ORF Transcript_9381/g.14035 Transcript_9381/m.14035 type:complete len:321 (+) Transcript_9381:115-1077(+)
MKATRPSFFVSSILFSQSGWTKSSAFAIPHERSDSTFAQSSTITKLSSPRAVNYLSIRGGDGRNVDIISRNVINPAVASLVAGSVAGAIGVGVAFPLDTLKTKSQVLASSQRSGGIQTDPSSGTASLLAGEDVTQMNMFELFVLIYKMEGIGGFYGGVRGMMVGQAVIKSVAFSANQIGLSVLKENAAFLPSAAVLLGAAFFSGFVTSFLVTPIERVKVLMQASNKYKNEIHCLQNIIKSDDLGFIGLFSRGLGLTLAREVPSYGIYFLIYGLLMALPVATTMGNIAPLVFGAFTGMVRRSCHFRIVISFSAICSLYSVF